jgi:uncharacterized protein
MLGNMRRKDRAMTREECDAMLERVLVGRLATADLEGMPYITPMNYVYESTTNTVYLHSGRHVGHMQTNLRANPKVCFEIDEPGPVIATGEYACNTSQVFESVVIFGVARIMTDEAERRDVLHRFIDRYINGLMPDRDYNSELNLFASTTSYAIAVQVMTGKRREMPMNIQQPASVMARLAPAM